MQNEHFGETTPFVGFTGAMGSGKSEAARALEQLGYRQAHPADPIREMLSVLLRRFGYREREIHEYLLGSKKREVIPKLGVTSTYLQQTLGTEWGRNLIKPTLWTDLLDIETSQGLFYNDSIRFISEENWLRVRGGKLIRIERAQHEAQGERGEHISETEQKFLTPDVTLVNDSTLNDLRMATRAVVLCGVKGKLSAKTIALSPLPI